LPCRAPAAGVSRRPVPLPGAASPIPEACSPSRLTRALACRGASWRGPSRACRDAVDVRRRSTTRGQWARTSIRLHAAMLSSTRRERVKMDRCWAGQRLGPPATEQHQQPPLCRTLCAGRGTAGSRCAVGTFVASQTPGQRDERLLFIAVVAPFAAYHVPQGSPCWKQTPSHCFRRLVRRCLWPPVPPSTPFSASVRARPPVMGLVGTTASAAPRPQPRARPSPSHAPNPPAIHPRVRAQALAVSLELRHLALAVLVPVNGRRQVGRAPWSGLDDRGASLPGALPVPVICAANLISRYRAGFFFMPQTTTSEPSGPVPIHGPQTRSPEQGARAISVVVEALRSSVLSALVRFARGVVGSRCHCRCGRRGRSRFRRHRSAVFRNP